MHQKKLEEYARLLVEVGIHIRKKQKLVISCQVDHAPFARMCADIAYQNGCAEVILDWADEHTTRARYLHADGSVFDFYPAYRAAFSMEYAKSGAAFLHLVSDDPQILSGVDADRIKRARKSQSIGMEPYREWMNQGENPWCIGALASPAWAKLVFPELDADQAMDALWDKIFAANRVAGDGSAVSAWQEHVRLLGVRTQKLNAYRFVALHYYNALGTDLHVGLCSRHVWESGGDTTVDGQFYMPNMPTEEIFTAPQKDNVYGVVHASLPLCLDGSVISNIKFVLRDGKIVEASASSGEDLLKNAISIDEGASYLGEVALVPYDSPIRNTNTLFYKTLFDENAACHFAFGRAYPTSVKDGIAMTSDERAAAGLNASATHVDFMIGTADLSIDGIMADGSVVPVFRNGNFAF